MFRKNRAIALFALLCLPACTSKWVKLPVTAKLTVMDADSDCGGGGCVGGCPFHTGPSIPTGQVRIGYVHKNDDGTPPLPCWWWVNYVMRGAVRFTLPPANEPNQGISDGKLHYRASGDGGKPLCQPVRAAIATKPWSSQKDFAITDGSEVFNQSIPLGQGTQTIQVPLVVLAKWYLGQEPNHGYVFLGPNESFGNKANKSCATILSDFELEIRITKQKK